MAISRKVARLEDIENASIPPLPKVLAGLKHGITCYDMMDGEHVVVMIRLKLKRHSWRQALKAADERCVDISDICSKAVDDYLDDMVNHTPELLESFTPTLQPNHPKPAQQP